MELAELMQLQHQLQVTSFDNDPTQLDPEARATFLTWNAWAINSELVEAMDECGWKPWATNRSVNVDAALGELVDALHFFANMALAIGGAAGMGPEEIGDRLSAKYLEKREINAERQRQGYDGVTNKCWACKRDLAEGSVTLTDSVGRKMCICGELVQ